MAANDELEQKLRDGIAAVQRGDKGTARRLLEDVIQQDRNNELAWMWLASAVSTSTERREALQRVLEINPNNDRAREALKKLGGGTRRATGADDSAEMVERVRRAQQIGNRTRRNAPASTASSSGDDGGFNPGNLLLGFLVAIVIVGGLLAIAVINQNNTPDPTPIPVVALPTSPPVQPTPRRVIATAGGNSTGPTLPPTFTATSSPTPTVTPTPTATGFPVEQFVLYYTSIEAGESVPALYRINADGSGQERLGSDFRDIAIDPSGRRIAFVRNVSYADDESPPPTAVVATPDPESTAESTAEAEPAGGLDGATYPELFIANLDDLDNPVQITELRSRLVASPAWSPGGLELVFIVDDGTDEEVYTVGDGGGGLRPVTDNDVPDRQPSWFPVFGSREIILASQVNTLGQNEIYRITLAEPGDPIEYEQLTNASNTSYAPRWSDDASMIVFLSDRRGDGDIYTMNAEGFNEQLLTSADGDAEDRSPVLSPDGQWVAFISNREDDRFQTYLLSIDGRVLVRLTNHDGTDLSLDFAPNREALGE